MAAGLLAGAACTHSIQAQSSDALVDKLVEKGILTVKEANDLREEADKGFSSAYAVKSGMPEWVTALKFNGDLRGRYEGFYATNPNFVDRSRMRYRIRFGATAVIKDDFEVGFRLTSSEPTGTFGGDPISGNTSFSDNGAKKSIFVDLAYGKWTPIHSGPWTGGLTIGKMENPFTFSEMVFDTDYTPEGVAAQMGYAINEKHALKLNLAGFALDEVGGSSQDPYLVGTQVRFDSVWSPKISTTAGAALLAISGNEGLVNAAVPNMNRGNTRNPAANAFGAGPLVTDFNPLVADASATYSLESFPYYSGPFPIKVGGEYMNNLAADDKAQAFNVGVTFGKAGKRGTWEIGYKWKQLERDAWYEELVDSDTGAYYQAQFGVQDGFTAPGAGYGAGTNVRGHVVKASYSPFDSFTLTATCFLTELIDENPVGSNSKMTRLQVDANWKF
jgi:hypothetical protein